MATNLYGKSCTPNLGGVQDFYTKAEVNQLLGAKANTSTTYTRAYIDGELATLSSNISSLDADKIDQTQLDSSLSALQFTIESTVAAAYATIVSTYTKSEVDSLIAAIDLDPTDYVRSAPTTTSQNTIYPGTADAIALTVRGSSTNAIVTRWLDSSSNVIGHISNSGSTTLNGSLSVGQTTSPGEAAVDANNRRITGVASPVLGSDAVPYSTLQTYILDFYQEITLPGQENYSLDAGFYPDPGQVRSLYRHLRSETLYERPSGLDIYEGEIALNFNTTSPGLFIKDTEGKIRKIGPAHVGASSPVSSGLSNGEMWVDKSGPVAFLKYYDESDDNWIELGSVLTVIDGGGDGSLGYDSSTATLTYTGPSAAEVRAHFSGGTGVTITDGTVAIGQPVATTDNVTFNNVDISGTLDVTGVATFDTKISIGAAEPAAEAEVGWNTDKGTLDIGLLSGVISPYGQDIITSCRNSTASTIPKGAAVMFTGTIGNSGLLTVAPMVADGTYPGYVFFGVAAQNIAAGEDGYVRSFGEIRGVDTDIHEVGLDGQWAEGDILWCDPATPGGFTKFEPLAPNLKLPVAAVVSVGNNGILFVRWDTGRRLQDLHDVDANGATTNGDLLQYNASASRWEHRTNINLPGTLDVSGLVFAGSRQIKANADTGNISLIGGDGTGANIELYGGSHPSSANLAVIGADELRIIAASSPTERMRISSDGTVDIAGNLVLGPNSAPAIKSDTTGVTGADQITNMMSLTQAEYDAIGTPDANTFYVITA